MYVLANLQIKPKKENAASAKNKNVNSDDNHSVLEHVGCGHSLWPLSAWDWNPR